MTHTVGDPDVPEISITSQLPAVSVAFTAELFPEPPLTEQAKSSVIMFAPADFTSLRLSILKVTVVSAETVAPVTFFAV